WESTWLAPGRLRSVGSMAMAVVGLPALPGGMPDPASRRQTPRPRIARGTGRADLRRLHLPALPTADKVAAPASWGRRGELPPMNEGITGPGADPQPSRHGRGR